MKKTTLIVFGILIITACVVVSVIAKNQLNEEVTIDGYIKDGYGHPVPGALVEVYANKNLESSITTVEGYYLITFKTNKKKNAKIIVFKEGYKSANRGIHPGDDAFSFNFTMAKINEKTSDKAITALQYIGKRGKERNIGCKVAPYKNKTKLNKDNEEVMEKQGVKKSVLDETVGEIPTDEDKTNNGNSGNGMEKQGFKKSAFNETNSTDFAGNE